MQQLKIDSTIKGEMIKGGFGLERECIRVTGDGVLSHKPHPKALGDKLLKKYITTDFSESQVEMITPVFDSVIEMYNYAGMLYDFVVSRIGDEYLWCQSMPCIIDGNISVALYNGEKGRQATEYREMLVKRYGGEKQLISGIHFNFSLSDGLLKVLYERYGMDKEYRLFVDEVYLKIARNYIRYGFLITYLCGSSGVCHSSFDKRCISTLSKRADGAYETKEGISLRNSKWGYRNLEDLFPEYKSAQGYVDSIYRFIDEGKISYAKEYYSSLRLKGINPDIDSLKSDGIKYIELRTIDINPFSKVGVDVLDLQFTHLFLLLMLTMEESCYSEYQKDGQDAKEKVSVYGLKKPIFICGKEVDTANKCRELIEQAGALNDELGLYDRSIIDFQLEKLEYESTYAAKNRDIDFIKGSLDMMSSYKNEGISRAKNLTDAQIENMLSE